jgi:DNA-binding beta-propeller fold protein YncE
MMRGVRLPALLAVVVLSLTFAATALGAIQPSGRRLAPYGKLATLGNHPGGGALTTNGRFLWALDSGRGRNDIRIVDVAPELGCTQKGRHAKKRRARCRKRQLRRKKAGRVIQTIPIPGLSGGIAMAPNGRTAYVSGVADSPHLDERAPPGTPGLEGDVIHVFRLNRRSGVATRAGVIPVPPPPNTAPPQNFPPTTLTPLSWPRDLAVSRNGRTLVAALNLADSAAIVDTRTRSVSYVKTGSYPYGAAITHDGRTALVSNEADGTVSFIDLSSKRKVADLQVGAHLSHPEGIAIDPSGHRAFVAVAAEDKVAVVDTRERKVERNLSTARRAGNGSQPVALTVTHDSCRLLTAESGADSIAVHALRRGCDIKHRRGAKPVKQWSLVGRIPTASYPVFAGATPHRERLVWIAAKGLGTGPNPNGPNPLSPLDSDDNINSFQYLPSIVTGLAGTARFPADRALRRMTRVANAQIKPIGAEAAPAGTPLRPNGPIKHVFYVVRENRTYDQVLGDDGRGAGDPNLAIFGRSLTPNAHALAERFPLLDHVFANSEASIDGHFWTSAGAVSDYVVKNWHANYAARGRPYDFGVYAVTWPAKRFLFDQAEKQGISYFNYGEAIAGTVPLTDKDRTSEENNQVITKFSHSDLGEGGATIGGIQVPSTYCYPNDASIGKDAITGQEVYDSTAPATAVGALSRVECFRQRFNTQVTTGSVPAFNYLVLTNDHTNGLAAGRRTPQAMVADNDYALGEIVDTISHSPVWDSSLILVMEDDSQDGADHVDAHRIPAFAISPYTKRGAVVSTRYDFPSLIRTLELPLGMQPLTLFDGLATPLYDAFDSSPQNGEPYTAIPPSTNLSATNPNTAENRRFARRYRLTETDQVPQHALDRMLWHAVKGRDSKPPPPGPNAQREEPGEDADG